MRPCGWRAVTRRAGNYEPHVEVYQPPYLFQSNGSLATRPTITSAPATISYGNNFTVQTPNAANIARRQCWFAMDRSRTHSAWTSAWLECHSPAGLGFANCHCAAQWQYRAAWLLHAVPAEHRGCAVGFDIRANRYQLESRAHGEFYLASFRNHQWWNRSLHRGYRFSKWSNGSFWRHSSNWRDGGEQHHDYGNNSGSRGRSYQRGEVTNTDGQSGDLSGGYTYTSALGGGIRLHTVSIRTQQFTGFQPDPRQPLILLRK